MGEPEEQQGPTTSKYPTRQKKLGPAPFASFEDLSEDAYPYQPSSESSNKNQQRMPEIEEDEARSPLPVDGLECGRGSVGGPFFPSSGPTSGLQTPSTPRIDISCASSGTPQSESSSEKEMFQCSLGLAFQEDGTDDLRSSTEELGGEEEREGGKKRGDDVLRRASHPPNLFHHPSAKISVSPDLDEQVRKLSTHSMCLDGIHSRSTRHASFGAGDFQRPGAHSSLSAHSNLSGRRSSSPHKMLLETSFCGNKPIPTPSMDLGDDSPPSAAASTEALTPRTPLVSRKQHCSTSSACLSRQDSDSSLSQTVGGMLSETRIQVHHHFSPTKSPPDGVDELRKQRKPVSSTNTKPQEIPLSNNYPSSAKADRMKFGNASSSLESEAGGQTIVANPSSTLESDLPPTTTPRSETDAPSETKGLFGGGSMEDDDEELPYIPTTLPQEKSAFVSMVPVKERRFEFRSSNPIQRPRCINPPNLASIHDYIVGTPPPGLPSEGKSEEKKMRINLPREDSASELPLQPKSPKRKGGPPTSWTDFAEMGLRSPREIRRRMKEENGTPPLDMCSYTSDPSEGSMSGNNWSDGDVESLQAA